MAGSLDFDISPQYPLPNYGVGAQQAIQQPFAGGYNAYPSANSPLSPLSQDTFGARQFGEKYYGTNNHKGINWGVVLAEAAAIGGILLGAKHFTKKGIHNLLGFLHIGKNRRAQYLLEKEIKRTKKSIKILSNKVSGTTKLNKLKARLSELEKKAAPTEVPTKPAPKPTPKKSKPKK